MMVTAVIIAGIVSFFAELFFRMLFRSRFRWGDRRSSDDRKGWGGAFLALVIAVALIALAWLLSVLIRFGLSRRREFLADAGSVGPTRHPDPMITALPQ